MSKKLGRTTKLTKELQEDLVSYISEGITFKGACALVSINPDSFYNWKKKGKEDVENGVISIFSDFFESINKANQLFIAKHIQSINKFSKVDWKASAWMLEMRDPENFSKTKNLNMTGEMSINNMSNEERDKKIDEMLKLREQDENK